MVNIEVSVAPKNAPEAIPMPLIVLLPMPARLMVTIAAPSPDPALIPIMCGSARGLRKMLCICAPDTAIAAPARIAVNILGSLSFKITAVSARLASPIDMSINPMTINMMIPMATKYLNLFSDFI